MGESKESAPQTHGPKSNEEVLKEVIDRLDREIKHLENLERQGYANAKALEDLRRKRRDREVLGQHLKTLN